MCNEEESDIDLSLEECAIENECYECTIPSDGTCIKATMEKGEYL